MKFLKKHWLLLLIFIILFGIGYIAFAFISDLMSQGWSLF